MEEEEEEEEATKAFLHSNKWPLLAIGGKLYAIKARFLEDSLSS